MRKGSARKLNDDLRPEYDLTQLKGGVRGKYYQRAKAGTNLVLVDPDLARAFPNGEAVNRALRLLLRTANAATTPRRRAAPTRRSQRTARRVKAA
jgi:hypothetical protein